MAQDAKKEVLGFGDQINFTELFRVKGRQGLFTLRSSVHKSGTVGVLGFLDYNRKLTVMATQMECLGALVFTTLAGNDDVRINTVFNNLAAHEEKNGDVDFEKFKDGDLLELMAPNYDDNFFKIHHAKKCLMWYKEITTKLKEIEEPTEG